MKAINYTTLRDNMKETMDRICEDSETYIVTRKKNQNVVIMSEEEYGSIMETLYLMKDKKNYEWLTESLRQAKEGAVKKHELL